ncbi:serine/threonine-protein kinase [Nocardioides baculatus]|uniref:non-specific serine/threonine protein kinase n=1 Tax=Nocardioides baculatus TaxID=2801337 RepID=A0ABS1LDB4_9ACTN|nr:serine/threonine-protein kinase [Nocardioides baculatus]MBL0749679.1 serine/threonine protein kinase [Nocardioides baculatus]
MIAGRYTLDREIGRGGAGIVHLAHDEVLGRTVAIKRIGLLPGTTDRDIERAQREARIAAGITHPHVVSILDLVKDVDCYWIVMEHVRGRTLAEVVRADGALRAERAAGILAQAADALVHATRAGIVHRDVKPSNIMVGDDDHAKLGDFGIARGASDSALTVTGEVTGSPAYLAPEVASGSPATAASDVWSLGATLFHAVMGRAPYDVGGNVMGGLYRIVHEEPPRLPADHALAGVLAHSMVKDPGGRWSAERVRDELRRIARGGRTADATTRMETVPVEPVPVATPPPATGPPAQREPVREPRRAPLGWIAAAAVLVLLAALGAWLLWPGDGQRPEASDPTTQQSEEPSEEPSQEPSSAEPSETASEEPSTDSSPSPGSSAAGARAEVQALLQDYFSLVTSDPEASFDMLTPAFQEASGGFGRYSGFWSTIRSARVSDVRVDAQSLTTTYTIDYVTTSGRTTTSQGRLQLVRQGNGYLIAAEG